MARLRLPSGGKLALLATIIAVLCTLAFVRDVTSAEAPSNPTATPTVSAADPSAGCDGSLTAVAIARTQASQVTICADQKGAYLYRGVRLSDGAALNVPAEVIGAREFVARNEDVTYSLSPQQLVVTAGDTVVRREPVIEYREPRSYPAEAPPR
jgi:hypothetical protein